MAKYPYVVTDPASMLGGRFGRLFVMAPTFCGARAVYRMPSVSSGLGVFDRVIHEQQLPLYGKQQHEEETLQSLLLELKQDMLDHGASPEAVQLVGAVSPFTKGELNTMAEKLTRKAAPKAAKPAAPKAAKVAKAPQADRTYKHLVKRADIKAREGSWTAAMVDIIMAHKSTYAAKAALAADKTYGDRRVDFAWAEKKGYIAF